MPNPSDAAVAQTPKFGDWMRGIYASEKNPLRDGMFVRTIRRTGRCNPGTYYELTDGRGKFWQYPRESTVMLDADTRAQAPAAGVTDASVSEKAESLCVHCFSPPYNWGMVCCKNYWNDPRTEMLTATQAKERRAAMTGGLAG